MEPTNIVRDVQDLREAQVAAVAHAVEQTRAWIRGDDGLDDLARRGRLSKRTLPDGGVILQIEKSFHGDFSKGVKNDSRVVESVTSSTSEPDRYNDTLQAGGWKLKNFRRNPVMPIDHSYRVENLAGFWSRMDIEGRGDERELVGDAQFLPEGLDRVADMTFAKIVAKALRTVSVGFQSLKREERKGEDGTFIGYNFLEQELLEVSWVVVPANPSATIHDVTPEGTRADEPAFDSALVDVDSRMRAAATLSRLVNRR